MFNRTFIALVVICICTAGFGQNFDQRLIDHFGTDHLTYMQQNAPNVLVQHNFYLENAVRVDLAGQKNVSTFPDVSTISLKPGVAHSTSIENDINSGTFNPFLYELGQHETAYRYYKIGNTGKVLAVLPRKVYTQKLNDHVGSSYE